MFKAIKEFLFGKLPEQKPTEAPYKVEATVVPVADAAMSIVEPAPVVAETAPVAKPKAEKKPRAKKAQGEKKPAAKKGGRKPKTTSAN